MLGSILETRKMILTFLICFVITALMIGANQLLISKGKKAKNLKNYNELIVNGTEKEGELVSVTLSEPPYLVATYEDQSIKDKYYILIDQKDMMYVALLSDQTYKEVEKQRKEKSTYTLTGQIYNTPEELKDIIIDMYQEDGEDQVNTVTFDNYFGTTYLDTNKQKYSTITSILSVAIFILGLMTVIAGGMLVFSVVRTRITLGKISSDSLNAELEMTDLSKFKKAKIYITPHYLLSVYLGLRAVKLEDILWVYISHSNNQIKMARLTIHLKGGKRVETMKCKIWMEDILRDAIQELLKKKPELLVGYSYENLTAYNDMK
ncbi:MAG: hypothetical protein K6G64_10580 [Eubacterium sp.]|nr:hypothetical protein [Eubacterium sp.]